MLLWDFSTFDGIIERLYWKNVWRLPKYLPPTPSLPGECVHPAFGAGGGYTRWVERGAGGQYFGRCQTQLCTLNMWDSRKQLSPIRKEIFLSPLEKLSVSDPYSFFPDPDPEVEAGDQYGSGSGSTGPIEYRSNPDPDPKPWKNLRKGSINITVPSFNPYIQYLKCTGTLP